MALSQKYEKYLNNDLDKVGNSMSIKELDNNGSEIDVENNGIVIIDGAVKYSFQDLGTLIKMENMVETPVVKRKVTAQTARNSSKNNTFENNSEQKNDLNETISSNAENEVYEVYEFNENEQDVDDPQVVADADYESKGVVKNIKKANADESFNCIMCAYRTNKKFLLSKHMKIHSDERPYKCAVCERGFKSSASLINHKNTHLGRKPHACKDCDKAFTTSGELVRHVRYCHTHIKPHKCTECEYRSVERSKLRRHMRCHTGERPYQCPHCTYASPDTFKLKRHLRTHTGEKPYECDICHARFTQRNSLKYHRLIHSVNEKPVFQCHLCPTTCGRKTDLRLHIQKLHCSDQPIPCKRCGKELPDRYSYKMHVKTHQGEKCYRCDYCPYASVSQRHLESHISIHLDEKPFECEICQTSFRQKQLYTRHMKIFHSDNYVPPQPRKKDRKCPHCDKMFAFNGYLIRHMETHDPNSRLSEEKYNLKLGRLKRVQKDGTVTLPENTLTVSSDDYIYEETEETEKAQVKNEVFNEEEYEDNYNNDDSLNYVYEDFEIDDYDGEEALENEIGKEQDINGKKLLIEVKMEKTDGMDKVKPQPQQKDLSKLKSVKNNADEILEATDDQGYVVIEVLPDDDVEDNSMEDETQTPQENSTKIVYLRNKVNGNNEAISSDYFGFEVDEQEDEEAKGAIKLFEMIEQE